MASPLRQGCVKQLGSAARLRRSENSQQLVNTEGTLVCEPRTSCHHLQAAMRVINWENMYRKHKSFDHCQLTTKQAVDASRNKRSMAEMETRIDELLERKGMSYRNTICLTAATKEFDLEVRPAVPLACLLCWGDLLLTMHVARSKASAAPPASQYVLC